uniref:Uncharacterized protein n=1 Tax=Oryza rufipogon TaxID=4529 RepID=A0A0E0QYA2_ORYRU
MPLGALMRARVLSPLRTIWNASPGPGDATVATTVTPSPATVTNRLSNTLRSNVSSSILHSLKVSHPEALVRFATRMVPPPCSAHRRSLFGMSSKRDGRIQPSVTSQPPRFTARMGGDGAPRFAGRTVLPSETEKRHGEQRRRKRRSSKWRMMKTKIFQLLMTILAQLANVYIYTT